MSGKKKCTYASTGANYSTQEWYECRTCGLADGSGVCAICAQSCHKGHSLSAPKNSRFYCDCGASGNCQAMGGGAAAAPSKPPSQPAPSVLQSRVTVTAPPQPVRVAPSQAKLNLVQPKSYQAEDLPVDASSTVIRLPPLYFVHILDTNTSVTTVISGPATVTRRDHETLVLGPRKMIVIPPFHYAVIADPVQRDDKGEPVIEKGLYRSRFGERKVELKQEPFVLYPNEKLVVGVTPLQIVPDQTALRLRASRDFVDNDGVSRHAGEEWLFRGPRTYVPLMEAEIVEAVQSIVLLENQALKLRARIATTDAAGRTRKAGEEWLWRTPGAYLAGVDEQVEGVVNAIILTESKALHLRATRAFDDGSVQRKAGFEWLVTYDTTTMYIPDVYEAVVALIDRVVLNTRQWCVVVNPVDAAGVPQLGRRELRRGPRTFFLQPGEELEAGIQNVHVMAEGEALLVKATEAFRDDDSGVAVPRTAGDRWLILGPREYVPPVAVQLVDRRSRIALGESEGIYVRDIKTGAVRAVIGQSYMLKADEELWAKELQTGVAALLQEQRPDPTRVVTYRVPHNAAMQIYDYRQKAARVVFGPQMVTLQPDEQFTQLTLSGGKPKRTGEIRALVLLLGPDYMTDILQVETADHARLNLKLSYAWRFDIDKTKDEDARKLFQVPDFVGDCCKAIASRVRGMVASVPFDMFHKQSATIINEAVFGNEGKTELRFTVNNLVVNAVDIQSVEPVDQRTRDALMKSVQMAIEITTQSQEANALHAAQRTEQEAIGELERQRIEDEALAERARRELLDLKAQSSAVKSTGQAKAEAQARAEAANIEGQSAVELAKLRAEAASIESSTEITRMSAYQQSELTHQTQLSEIEIQRTRELAAIETKKFKTTVDAIGRETIMQIAQAGPEMQAKLLAGLGLQGFLVTDGNSPINLFNTANGLIGGATS